MPKNGIFSKVFLNGPASNREFPKWTSPNQEFLKWASQYWEFLKWASPNREFPKWASPIQDFKALNRRGAAKIQSWNFTSSLACMSWEAKNEKIDKNTTQNWLLSIYRKCTKSSRHEMSRGFNSLTQKADLKSFCWCKQTNTQRVEIPCTPSVPLSAVGVLALALQ